MGRLARPFFVSPHRGASVFGLELQPILRTGRVQDPFGVTRFVLRDIESKGVEMTFGAEARLVLGEELHDDGVRRDASRHDVQHQPFGSLARADRVLARASVKLAKLQPAPRLSVTTFELESDARTCRSCPQPSVEAGPPRS